MLTADGTGPAARRRSQRLLAVGLISIVTFVAFEALAVATVLPEVRDDLGGEALYGWAFSAFLLANIVSLTWAGGAADRYGPARPLSIGITLFAAGLIVAGLAPTMGVFVAGRALQGLGAGAVPTVAYVVIGRAFAPDERPRMFAYLASAWVIPGLAGPGAAAAIAEFTSWRVVFLGLLGPLAVAVPLTLPGLIRLGRPRDVTAAGGRLALAVTIALGAALALAGLALLGDGEPVGVLLALPGVAVTVIALRRLWPAGTLALRPGLPALIAGNAYLNLAFFGAEAFIPLALADLRDQPAWVAGLALSVATVSWTTGTWIVERKPAWQVPGRAERRGRGLAAPLRQQARHEFAALAERWGVTPACNP